MGEPNFSIGFTAQMLAASACALGNLLVYDAAAGYWRVSTTGNRTTANALSQAVALTAYGGSAVGKVSYQSSGVVAQSITGLSTGYGSRTLVRTSATGTMERIVSYTAGDDVIGYAESDGRVHLHFGLPWGNILALSSFPIQAPGTSGHMIVYSPDGLGGMDGGSPPSAGEFATMSNLGAGAGLVYISKVAGNFNLRSILAGAGVLVTNNLADITVAEQRVQVTNAGTGPLNNVTTLNGSGVEARVLEFTGAGTINVTGLANGAEGRAVFLIAPPQDGESGTTLVLKNQDGGSSAANRICTPGQQDFEVANATAGGGGGGVWVVWDTTAARWRVAAPNPSKLGRTGTSTTVIGATVAMNLDAAAGINLQSADGFYWQAQSSFVGTNAVNFLNNPSARLAEAKVFANVQTTDATVTTIYSFTPTDESATLLDVSISVIDSTGAKTAIFKRYLRVKRDGGTTTIGTADVTFTEQEAALSTTAITFDVSGTAVRVRVTGVAATTLDWGGTFLRNETNHA